MGPRLSVFRAIALAGCAAAACTLALALKTEEASGHGAAPPLSRSYGWPLAPFDRQHAIRGFFDDPREHIGIGGSNASFHFGIDISAADGTGVYAVAPGVARVRGDKVTVTRRGRSFAYWHLLPEVTQYQHVVLHQLLGRVRLPWEHVHFAEREGGVFVNPLRPGALEPYADTTTPVVTAITLSLDRLPVDLHRVHGVIEAIAEAYDTPPLRPPPPWEAARATPALLKWRLIRRGGIRQPWRIAADFRYALLPPARYGFIYAPGTRQNHASHPGRFRFWLSRGFDTRALANGRYRIDVEAVDIRGNLGTRSLAFTIANH